jgi:hypothetical protein
MKKTIRQNKKHTPPIKTIATKCRQTNFWTAPHGHSSSCIVPMNEKEITMFIEPKLKIMRAVSNGAGDREVQECKKAIGEIVVRFPYAPVMALAQIAFGYLDDALKFVDFQKKNEAATRGAEYFVDRVFVTICECENSKTA